jgi:hypothetical protein
VKNQDMRYATIAREPVFGLFPPQFSHGKEHLGVAVPRTGAPEKNIDYEGESL